MNQRGNNGQHRYVAWARRALAALFFVTVALITGISEADEPVASPEAVCLEPSWNFGKVANSNTVEHIFELLNLGGSELIIERVSVGCGCTAARTGSDRLAPGGKTQITVKLNLAGRIGAQRKAVYVHTNDPRTRILRLEIAGEAAGSGSGMADLVSVDLRDGVPRVEPERIDFGKIKAGVTSEGEITLVGADSSGPIMVDTGTPDMTARVETGGVLSRISLSLVPSLLLGPHETSVTIKTGDKRLGTISVPVRWNAEGDIYAIPEEIIVVGNDAAVRYVAIRSKTGKIFGVSSAESGSADIRTELTPLTGSKGYLVKTFLPSSSVARTNGVLTISCDTGLRLTVPIKTIGDSIAAANGVGGRL